MKTLKLIAIAVLLLSGAVAGAQTMGISDGHDLDALWASAQKMYDTAQEDAVILLDSRTTTVGDEGTVVTRVHQVVWIATSQGIRGYADLRVPWNSETSTLEVEKLRTWMGGRWWPDPEQISETAVVETLPYAVALADDYTMLRETMLLHDGVELPCIMETAYTIAVQGSPTAGADDVFVFPGRDPVVRSEYAVRVPAGVDVKFESLNGAPQPVVATNGVKELTWTMDGAGALKQPVTADPEAYEPSLIWTTWENWDALLREFDSAVEAASPLNEALEDSLAAIVRGLPEGLDRTMAAIKFADDAVRIVHTDFLPWLLAPRPAVRTWETGYGHALDRAVLVAALMKAADPQANIGTITLWRLGFGEESGRLPRAADLDGLEIVTRTATGDLVYDPGTGSIRGSNGGDSTSRLPFRFIANPPVLRLDVSLEPGDAEWQGTGNIYVAGDLFDYAGAMTTDADYTSTVQSLLAGLLDGLDVTWAQPTATQAPRLMAARFGFKMPAPTVEDDRPLTLVVGVPAAGLSHQLPRDVNVSDATRESPVRLEVPGEERITIRIHTGTSAVRGIPSSRRIANSAGAFELVTSEASGWLTIERKLALDQRSVMSEPTVITLPGATWPDLRALLLENKDPANGTIVLEKKK